MSKQGQSWKVCKTKQHWLVEFKCERCCILLKKNNGVIFIVSIQPKITNIRNKTSMLRSRICG